MKEKRAKLENLLRQLIDRNNRKLKRDLDTYCKGLKRKRNRTNALSSKDNEQFNMAQERSREDGGGYTGSMMIT